MNGSPCSFTPDEMRTAVRLWKSGTMVKDIGERLGRNRSAVRDMLNAAGIKRLPGRQPFTEKWHRDQRPVGICKEEQRLREDAIIGSGQLLKALLRTGQRPC